MAAFKAYFKYEMAIGCGIPAIQLLGTVDDWQNIRRRAARFAEFGLQAWLGALLPILDKLVETASGRPDLPFWRSFFRYESDSGPAELTGWITVLFPYLLDGNEGDQDHLMTNPYWAQWQEGWEVARTRAVPLRWQDQTMGPTLEAIPSGLSSAPVKITDVRSGEPLDLQFVGGMFGVVQDPTSLALAPEFGWAIVREGAPKSRGSAAPSGVDYFA